MILEPQFKILEVIVTQTFLGTFVYLLIDFRLPRKRWKRRWLAVLLGTLCVNGIIICLCGYEAVYLKVWPLTMTLPYILNTLWVSKARGFRTLFNIGTALYIGAIAVLTAFFFQSVWPFFWIQLPVRAAILACCIPMICRLRKPYLKMLELLESGWGILCAIPFLITFLAYILLRQFALLKEPCCVLLMYLVLACGMCMYHMIYRFFMKGLKEQELLHEENILQLRIKASKDHLRAAKRAEKKLDAFWRQFLTLINQTEEEIRNGNLSRAREALSDMNALRTTSITRYCTEPVLNAVFSSFEQQAKKDGIEFRVQVKLPKVSDLNMTELAVVISNALSNAADACLAAPEEKPRKILVSINSRGGQIAAEIRNTCYVPVRFDENNIPVSEKGEGHGVGTKSMMAFARRTDAFLTFEEKDGWFTVRMLV